MMKQRPLRILLTLSLAAFVAAGAGAVDFTKGKVKLSLYPNNGNFSLYGMTEVSPPKYAPLLFDKDPRTSFISLIVNGDLYRLDDESAFKRVQSKGDTPELLFKSANSNVSVRFSFVSSLASGIEEGVKIDVTAENTANAEAAIGLKVVLDTYLGERYANHFYTDFRSVSSETVMGKDAKDSWVMSGGAASPTGLMLMLKGENLTNPSKVYLANWSKLNALKDFSDFKTNPTFTVQPYSINDSAVCLYYEPSKVASAGKITYTVILGNKNDKGFAVPAATASDSASATAASPSADAQSAPLPALSKDAAGSSYTRESILLSINDLLSLIDAKLQNPTGTTESEIAALQAQVDALEAKIKQYGD